VSGILQERISRKLGDAMELSPASSLSVAEILDESPYPAMCLDLETRVVLGANQACSEALDRNRDSIAGMDFAELVSQGDRSAVDAVLGLLASGAIYSYRASRHFLKGDGSELLVAIGVHIERVKDQGVVVVTLESDELGVPLPLVDASIRMALAITDHSWVVTNVSTDIEQVLGVAPEGYVGKPVLSLIHSDDVQSFVLATARVASGGDSATLRVHVLSSMDQWLEVDCVVVSMCRHSPPRVGLALAGHAEVTEERYPENSRQVAIRGKDCLDGMNHFRFRKPPESLSTRQWEILTRLIRGERVQEIASVLYLSPSTVRNHLTAIYRKFGVHSQSELLAEMLRATETF
jgi:DNA-binding NarL/FixJ family response regulator